MTSTDSKTQQRAAAASLKDETTRLVPVAHNSSKDDSDDGDRDKILSIWSDAKDIAVLGLPIFLAMLSWVGMKTTDSALLGHVSADALAAAALSDLVRFVFIKRCCLGSLFSLFASIVFLIDNLMMLVISSITMSWMKTIVSPFAISVLLP
jgi:hypothetical protein